MTRQNNLCTQSNRKQEKKTSTAQQAVQFLLLRKKWKERKQPSKTKQPKSVNTVLCKMDGNSTQYYTNMLHLGISSQFVFLILRQDVFLHCPPQTIPQRS